MAGPRTDQQQQTILPFIPDNSQRSSSGVVSIPVGLTSKELAHLRTIGPRLEPTDSQTLPDSSSESVATTDRNAPVPVAAEATPLPETPAFLSEVDLLRHEVQRLRAEISEPPPTYFSGEAA